MSLSSDLISQFVKITNDDTKNQNKETTVYGTARKDADGSTFVMLDGSSEYTPVPITANVKTGNRVVVHIKNHSAIITGNLSSPSVVANDVVDMTDSLDYLTDKVTTFETVIAQKVDTEAFNAEVGRITDLEAEYATVREELTANSIDVGDIKAENVEIRESLKAADGSIKSLQTDKLDATFAEATYAKAEDLEATNLDVYNLNANYSEFKQTTTGKLDAADASIKELQAGSLTTEAADIRYANIDFSNIGKAAIEHFYATSGLIEDVVVGDGTITGRLVGVTISGDLIEGNTVVAEKLVIKGEDGLYYKLNTDGVATEAEQTDYNSLNGSIIKAKSITATKIDVKDLVAFDATIGGFNITEKSLYSGVKDSVSNTSRGVFLDSDGQMAVGDASNFIKYYKDSDGNYKLAITADNIVLSSSHTDIGSAIDKAQNDIDSLEIGGRNLIRNGDFSDGLKFWASGTDRNVLSIVDGYSGNGLHMVVTDANNFIVPRQAIPLSLKAGDVLTLQVKVKTESGSFNEYNGRFMGKFTLPLIETKSLTGDWFLYVYQGVAETDINIAEADVFGFYYGKNGTFVLDDLKLEFGTKATDWTPAPEDLASASDLEVVQNATESAEERLHSAESLIQQLSESISMLVTDGNGTSLMTQTDEGWTFSTSEIQTAVNSISESLNDLTHEFSDTSNVVDILHQAVSDLGTLAEYIKIGTYEDEPCIELGEGDSEFKLRITNTRMIFTEGASVLAYFNNQSFHVKKAVVEDELQQGGFVWKTRSNGNLGLVWKGVSS